MTEEYIERLVTRILQRLKPAVLVMVTAQDGYRQLIRQRLTACGYPLQLALDTRISDADEWKDVGEVLPVEDWQEALPSAQYRAVLVPFLDYPLAAELVNGTLNSPVARRIHDALLLGLPVLALRYHCDPDSELNQLRGAAVNSAYAGHIQDTLARLTTCGVTLCTMSELLETLASGTGKTSSESVSHPRRYLTVTDIVNNPALVSSPDVLLTDAASDFLKNRKI